MKRLVVLLGIVLFLTLCLWTHDHASSILGLRPPRLAGKIVVIDPGHGGIDSGTSHPEMELEEKDLNLDIALRTAVILKQVGANVVMTREIDEMKGGNYLRDLDIRIETANQSGADALISIHVNHFPDPSVSGGQAFFAPGCDDGKALALLLQEEMAELQPGNTREVQAASYVMLTRTTMASVLVEVGFMSSPSDRALLADEAYREQLARAIVRALLSYFN